jgi:hypothetical protein
MFLVIALLAIVVYFIVDGLCRFQGKPKTVDGWVSLHIMALVLIVGTVFIIMLTYVTCSQMGLITGMAAVGN